MDVDHKEYQNEQARPDKRNRNAGLPVAIAFLGVGVVSLGMMSNATLLPLGTSVLIFHVTAWVGLALLLIRRMYLAAFYVMLFYMPLSSSIGYVFVQDYLFWLSSRAIPLGRDPATVSTMMWIAEIGLCGLLSGIFSTKQLQQKQPQIQHKEIENSSVRQRILGVPLFLFLALFALLLSWGAAPEQTIFNEAYGSQRFTRASSAGFNAGALSSYVLLILLQLDIYRTKSKSLKIAILGFAIFYIIIFLQLLRGDRESSGLIAGMVLVQLAFGSKHIQKQLKAAGVTIWKNIFSLVVLLVLVAAFVFLGSFRSEATNRNVTVDDLTEMLVRGMRQNTWTAAGVNNLALADEVVNQTPEYFFGKTYVDFFLSLPPSFVARAIGYERPINRNAGPGLWYRHITNGGTHAVIVPFKNFGAFGLLAFMGGLGLLLGFINKLDGSCLLRNQYIYGVFAVSGFKWFWYGEMNLIRACMAAIIFYFLYMFFVGQTKVSRGLPVGN